eukprot:comp15331_c0_seq1/m.12181 comp15331_c0_seq1/g.12181  ORF comp15331_c0_seq1/g.12181 comp15331_c0_seq1/m.12181 type:complete len:487 (-) comp15331_c0_seq1:820-2280(-)
MEPDFSDICLEGILTPVGKKPLWWLDDTSSNGSSQRKSSCARRLSLSSTESSPAPCHRKPLGLNPSDPNLTNRPFGRLPQTDKACGTANNHDRIQMTPRTRLAGALEGLRLYAQQKGESDVTQEDKENHTHTPAQFKKQHSDGLMHSAKEGSGANDKRHGLMRHRSQPYIRPKREETQKDVFKAPLPIAPSNQTQQQHSASPQPMVFSLDDDVHAASLPDNIEPPPTHMATTPTILPTVPGDGSHSYITPRTLVRLLGGEYKDKFSAVYVFDARYPYEYQGGHICGAINVYEGSVFDRHIAAIRSTHMRHSALPVCIVLHCEFSQIRGPRMFERLREQDRKENIHRYPQLSFPELYVLKGGYCQFFEEMKEYCQPQCYVKMRDKQFIEQYSEHRHKLKRYASWNGTGTSDRSNRTLRSVSSQPIDSDSPSCRASDLFGDRRPARLLKSNSAPAALGCSPKSKGIGSCSSDLAEALMSDEEHGMDMV